MSSDSGHPGAAEKYSVAHATHYTDKNLLGALELYKDVIAGYADAPEAGYARSQVANIVNSVVSKEHLLDAQIGLALTHISEAHAAEEKP